MLLDCVQGLVIMSKDLTFDAFHFPGGAEQQLSAIYSFDQTKKIQVVFGISWVHTDVKKLFYLQSPIK